MRYDKDLHERKHPHDEPVEAEECGERHNGGAGLSEEHEAQNDPGKALEQEDPPDVRLLRLQRYGWSSRRSP